MISYVIIMSNRGTMRHMWAKYHKRARRSRLVSHSSLARIIPCCPRGKRALAQMGRRVSGHMIIYKSPLFASLPWRPQLAAFQSAHSANCSGCCHCCGLVTRAVVVWGHGQCAKLWAIGSIASPSDCDQTTGRLVFPSNSALCAVLGDAAVCHSRCLVCSGTKGPSRTQRENGLDSE